MCANCIRLRLDCNYIVPRANNDHGALLQLNSSAGITSDFGESKMATGSQPKYSTSPEVSSNGDFQAVPPPPTVPIDNQGQLWTLDNEPNVAYAGPFQDVFFSSLDNFDVGLDLTASEAFLGPNVLPHTYTILPGQNDSTQNPFRDDSLRTDDERRKTLLEHFVKSANPVSVILPTHTEWTSACRTLLVMANDSRLPLLRHLRTLGFTPLCYTCRRLTRRGLQILQGFESRGK